jgi:hypothetical protein
LLCAAVALAASSSSFAAPAPTQGLSGQWVGSSQIDGRKATDKATLMLTEIDSDGSTLRIEGANACTLRKGKYSAEGDARWTLSFGDASGGDGCKRLAAGKFAMRRADNPRQIYLEATYHDASGGEAVRRAALSRYP